MRYAGEVLVLCFSLLVQDARAGRDPADAAELVRLTEELRSLAERHQWAGVERVYEALEDRGARLGYEEMMSGVQAARSTGRMQLGRDRLRTLSTIRPSPEVYDALAAIDTTYGEVRLTAPRRSAVSLEGTEAPFDPEQRAAIEAARQEVVASGGFSGLLPKGTYWFGGEPFVVQPGLLVRIDLGAAPRVETNAERKSP